VNSRRVLVCWPKVPFVQGGTEALIQALVQNLRNESVETDTIELPLEHSPHEALIRSSAAWRMLDVANGSTEADLLIATKFPSYFVQHPRKIVWLIHQFRQIYDWYGTGYSNFHQPRPDNYQALKWIVEQDRQCLQEAKAIYTISDNVRKRLYDYLGITSEVLYPPPYLQGKFYCDRYDPVILVVQRLESNKRTELLINSLSLLKGNYQVSIIGVGPDEEALRSQVNKLHLNDRITFLGKVSEKDLLQCYASCRLLYYAPFDEDYGFVTLEAFLSKKPVVTTTDSGGPLEFVHHQVNGWIASPEPEQIAEGLQALLENASLAKSWGEKGYRQYRHLNWRNTINVLLKHLS
jgi:glycosyltransferase involved in cell wall biosynthesis